MKKQQEGYIVKSIQNGLGMLNCRLWRNDNGAYCSPSGTWVRYGLGRGTPDLVGYRSIRVTPDMVGKRVAVFVGIECKMPGKRKNATKEQKAFIKQVNDEGGIGMIVESVDEAFEELPS